MAENAGFCFGVKRAIDIALQTTKDAKGPVFTLGPLIHNQRVVDDLQAHGIKVADSLEEVNSEDVLVIRSHGLSPETINQAKAKGAKVIDATCPFVKKAQKLAEMLIKEGYTLFIVGDKGHPEVDALIGYTDGKGIVVEDLELFNNFKCIKKAGVITQTTQSMESLQKVVNLLFFKSQELRIYNTICTATVKRQRTALEIANEVEAMVIVGGRNSANTTRLAALCRATGVPSYHVEGAEELSAEWFAGLKKVGVTAGASTPDWIIEEVISRMKDLAEEKILEEEPKNEEEIIEEEPENEEEEEVEEAQEKEESLPVAEEKEEVSLLQEHIKTLTRGEIVKGTISAIDSDGIFVDVGCKSEGLIPDSEFDGTETSLSVGDEIDVYVEDVESEEGNVLLSKKKADAESTWKMLRNALENKEIIEARVKERVKGGLLVDMRGVRGFVPASQISREYIENLEQFIGEALRFRVMELDRRRNNVVLSRRVVLEEEYEEAKAHIFDTLEAGEICSGIVKRITDFGAFVDIGSGVEGLLHVSEMAWSRIEHPSEVLSEGDEINVMVLGLDKDNERISLGLKQTKEDPWVTVGERYHQDDIVTGKVTKIVDFGAFVKLEDGIEGLIHISQLANRRVGNPSEVVSVGDEVTLKVLNVSAEERRIGLSLRALEEPAEERKKDDRQKENYNNQDHDNRGDADEPITIGEMVGNIFQRKVD